MKRIPALLILIFTAHCLTVSRAAANEDIDPQKEAKIRELLEVTGAVSNSAEFSRAFSEQMISLLRSANPSVSDEALTIVTEEVSKMVEEELGRETLQKEIYPIYASHFTLDELDALVVFNRSAVGQKANRLMPQLMQESLEAARRWAASVGPRMTDRIRIRFEQEGIPIGTGSSN